MAAMRRRALREVVETKLSRTGGAKAAETAKQAREEVQKTKENVSEVCCPLKNLKSETKERIAEKKGRSSGNGVS